MMKRAFFFWLIIGFTLNLSAQDFFRENDDFNKPIVVLTNPTVKNLKTINFLLKERLLKLKSGEIQFVGVYFEDQKYDFGHSRTFIDTSDIQHFFLHEVRGELEPGTLFEKNSCTAELKTIFNHSSGIFFFGGPDIPPVVYQEKNSRAVVTDPHRHYFETTFLFHLLGGSRNNNFTAFLHQKPAFFITGFCLGMQTMNVATGGTLIQDIPSELYQAQTPEAALKTSSLNLHCNYWQRISDDDQLMGINFHPILFTTHPFFGKKVRIKKNRMPNIYSSHHQAIEKLGQRLVITATSSDGKIIEAIAHQEFPHVFAVQFHPEVPALYEEGKPWKFHPSDTPATYHERLGRESVRFHQKYWRYVSKALRKAIRETR